MHFLPNARVIGDKTVSFLRGLNLSRASIFASHPKLEHTVAEESDQPIDLINPFEKEKKQCILCKYNIEPNYKNVRLLSQFQSNFTGRIYGRHITGLCKSKQEKVEKEILKAQHAGFMPIYNKEINYVNDPKIFDIDNPFKPHKY
ncbi:28S ribosomal protein S18c, mitochondrial [Copidosoma floridanum]|uniref:28S ribosomal protein S18c, mitochondrial n=1 Tax=Copidosoma floridanum TaxID=29053 RepID=UPI0006C9B56F|nr:28S ribosomal protein S18c, mitochondrial [Copidosoma floridanum]